MIEMNFLLSSTEGQVLRGNFLKDCSKPKFFMQKKVLKGNN